MRWYVGWRIDKLIPEKVFETGRTPQEAFDKMTHGGVIIGKIHQKIYGSYESRRAAEEAPIPEPSRSA